jgi:hypothetical protein
MANNFTRATSANVGLAGASVYTVPASTVAVVHGLFISNKTSSTVRADIKVGSIYVVKSVEVPANQTIIPDKPINLLAGDVLSIVSNTDSAIDVFVSILEVS